MPGACEDFLGAIVCVVGAFFVELFVRHTDSVVLISRRFLAELRHDSTRSV